MKCKEFRRPWSWPNESIVPICLGGQSKMVKTLRISMTTLRHELDISRTFVLRNMFGTIESDIRV